MLFIVLIFSSISFEKILELGLFKRFTGNKLKKCFIVK